MLEVPEKIFNIDINGMPEEIVDKNEVIMFSIEYK